MKKNLIFPMLMILVFAFSIAAQNKTADDKKQMNEKSFVKNDMAKTEANPADVNSIDAIIKATYDVISGEANEKRDWQRFHSLFHPDARLIPSGKNPQTNVVSAKAFTPDQYIERSEPFLNQGFFEQEISRKTQIFGSIAQVFSTYEAKKTASDEKPFMRGINSFQLLFDGKRWWIVTIYWQAETQEHPIPKEFLD